MKKKLCSEEGSLTVEAALTIPILLLVVLFFMYLTQTYYYQNSVNNALTNTIKYASISEGDVKIDKVFNNYADKDEHYAGVLNRKKGINVTKQYDKQGFMIADANYKCILPNVSWGRIFISMNQKMSVKEFSGNQAIKNKEKIVYITEGGKVYHTDSNCTYLKIKISKVLLSQVPDLRNESDGKYYACKGCCDSDIKDIDEVYITNYGTSYHKDVTCSKIMRIVLPVKISKVGSRTLCSKCKKNQGK